LLELRCAVETDEDGVIEVCPLLAGLAALEAEGIGRLCEEMCKWCLWQLLIFFYFLHVHAYL
jgi:hypothetical protein